MLLATSLGTHNLGQRVGWIAEEMLPVQMHAVMAGAAVRCGEALVLDR